MRQEKTEPKRIEQFKATIKILNNIADKVEEAVYVVCAFSLTLQTALICFQVFGRYIIKYIPAGTDDIALLCMVWTAILGMSLNVRDDAHLKMELVDIFVSESKIWFFQVISSILVIVFSVYMVIYGTSLWKLRWGAMMPSLNMTSAWYYVVLPISGVITAFIGFVFLMNTILKIVDHKLGISGDSGDEARERTGMEAKVARELSEAFEE